MLYTVNSGPLNWGLIWPPFFLYCLLYGSRTSRVGCNGLMFIISNWSSSIKLIVSMLSTCFSAYSWECVDSVSCTSWIDWAFQGETNNGEDRQGKMPKHCVPIIFIAYFWGRNIHLKTFQSSWEFRELCRAHKVVQWLKYMSWNCENLSLNLQHW